MRLFRKRSKAGVVRQADSADTTHLTAFAQSHTGVEAFVEPPTAVSTTTVVFVASTGEWTRRRVRDARTAHELANRLGCPPTTPRWSATRSGCATGTPGPRRPAADRQATAPAAPPPEARAGA